MQKMIALYGVTPDKFVLVPNGSSSRFSDEITLDTTNSHEAVFVGSNWPPNVEAAEFIVHSLADKLAHVRFNIVGSVCRSIERTKLPPNVILHYEVKDEDLIGILKRSHLALNPMKSGGGSNVKMSDYFAHGLRIITTPMGARGFPLQMANLEVVAIDDIADTIQTLATKQTTHDERQSWREAASPVWDWSSIAAPLVAALTNELPAVRNLRRWVILNEFPVRGADNGGEARVSGLLNGAQSDEIYIILSFGRAGFKLNKISEGVICLELPTSKAQLDVVNSENRGAYASVNDIVLPMTVGLNSPWLAAAEVVVAHSEGIIFSHPFMLPVYEHMCARRPFLLDSHNVESSLKLEALETHRRKAELVSEVSRQESFLAANAYLVSACSVEDAAHLRRLGAERILVAPNGVNIESPMDSTLADAITDEGRYGTPQFYARNCYFITEFYEISDADFPEVAIRAVWKSDPQSAADSELP
ncbi:MAG: glycosyltransferase, partial [Anaerolineales bacterium]